MVDAPDSKSGDRKVVWVRVPPPVLYEIAANKPKTLEIVRGPARTPGPFYTNYYTNTP